MFCEKYSGWLTDAALGELRAEREPELLAHAMECDACREALSHARAVHDFLDRGVESLVIGEPSPQFATNLRRRIALESEPVRSPWMAWAPVIVGSLALTAVLAIMVVHLRVHSEINPSVASAVTPVSAPSEAATASPASPQHAQRTEGKIDPERTGQARPLTTALPEVIVPQGQLSAAAQLNAAIVTGQVDGNQLLAAQQECEKPLEVKPIEIAPLEIPALDDATEKPAGSIQF
jgi:anti-sigma factor RsiW